MWIADENGNYIDAFKGFGGHSKMRRIAEKRTHKFALNMVRSGSPISLKDSLAAAYIQGINDAVLFNTKEKANEQSARFTK